MIYTSYFARLKDLPDNVVPVSICGKAPTWYKGLEYKKLAPIYEHFVRWKADRDTWRFAENYKVRVLGKLDAFEVVTELELMMPPDDTTWPYDYKVEVEKPVHVSRARHICLVCYEKSTDFCHRHYVREWLNENGIKCEEWR
jgi:hypothetical protein